MTFITTLFIVHLQKINIINKNVQFHHTYVQHNYLLNAIKRPNEKIIVKTIFVVKLKNIFLSLSNERECDIDFSSKPVVP